MGFGGIKRNLTDALFSDIVRERADWSCENCRRTFVKKESLGGSGLECSHFWSRRNKSVRWDFENAASFCSGCHRKFGENPAEHSAFFLKRLGQNKYDALGIRARTPAKIDEKSLRFAFKSELKELKERRIVLKNEKGEAI